MQATQEQQLAIVKELAYRKLEEQHKEQRENLYSFLKYYRETEKKQKLDHNRHLELICDKLEKVFSGEIKRLIINVPPRSLKTEIVSIAFPAWCIGKRHGIKFMDISYSSTLAEQNSWQCRNMYQSKTYWAVFPRSPKLKDDLNTKKHWENLDWWQYYASGSTGAITGLWCDIMVIDDPLKPDDAMSDVVRVWVNNNFHQTLKSRLNSKQDWAIVIIMQRLHDDDLCWHLIDLETKGGEKREKLIIKAIAEEDDNYRNVWDSFFETRFPLNILRQMKNDDPQWFSSQMQQEPTNKDTQEFHEERYKYHWTEAYPTPSWLRIFTAVDPAFKLSQSNDESCIITWWFIDDKLYILEVTAGRVDAVTMQDKLIYHIKKRQPEKVWIEAYQAQTMIKTFLVNELQRQWIHANIEEIRQTWDKLSKIRKLLPLYRNWLIYHKYWMDELEIQLKRFPRGKHDDIIDALQMLYDLYSIQPNSTPYSNIDFKMSWDEFWRPVIQ